ncbi:MAG: GDSL-type esterase/lipase family protein [Elusimicrobia bacterium]|nr:GDSL-type esterase/lipase family protein [Elusimicrobiota bacterium]
MLVTGQAGGSRRGRFSGWAVWALPGLIAGFLLAELGLAALGVQPHWRYCSRWALDDLQCRYRPKPGLYPSEVFGAPARVSAYGTRGAEPRRPLVLSLGDSCTFGVRLAESETYPALLSARGLETMNAGVPGHNSFSGRRWLRTSRLLEFRPQLVTVYYGWNDHWRAAASEKTFAGIRRWAVHWRLASLLLRFQASLWDAESPVFKRMRWAAQVPLSQFKDNLRGIIGDARDAGAQVVLITAPAEPRLAQAGQGWFASHSLGELADHEKYVGAVREVAAQTGVGLVDFAAEMETRRGQDPRRFFLDAMHLNAAGHRVLADLLAPWVRRHHSHGGLERPVPGPPS